LLRTTKLINGISFDASVDASDCEGGFCPVK